MDGAKNGMGKRERELWGEEGVEDPSGKNEMGSKHSRFSNLSGGDFEVFLTRCTSLSLSSLSRELEKIEREYGVKRVLRIQIGKKRDKGTYCLRIDEIMFLSLSLSFCLSTLRNVSKG